MITPPALSDSDPLLFVYGTLMRGFSNHGLLQQVGGEFIGTGYTKTRFPLVVDGLPYLLRLAGQGHHVEGEIWRVGTPEGWAALDRLEGHPDFYVRVPLDIDGRDGAIYRAWVYFLARRDARLESLRAMRVYVGVQSRHVGVVSPRAARLAKH